MPLIPTAEINRIKQDFHLYVLAKDMGYKLKKRGKDYVMLCPLHDEKTPSFSISEEKNCFHCFGCGESGSIIDFVMKTQRLSLPDAVAYIKGETPDSPHNLDNYHAQLRKNQQARERKHAKAEPAEVKVNKLTDIDDDGQALLNQVIDHYHQQLLNSPEAQEWLVRRGLNNPELISQFKLGFAGTHGVSGMITVKGSKESHALRARLSQLGVLREKTHQDHFRGCVVMPVVGCADAANVGQRGKVLQIYGRRIAPDYYIKKGSSKHLYIASPLAGVWNESAMLASSEIILCEALIDAMTFWCAGHRNVIAAYGVNGFNADHLNALLHHGVKKVLIAYDRDEAGDVAAEKLAVELQKNGIAPWRVVFPKGMDANEYALKNELPEKALGLVLQQAVNMVDPTLINPVTLPASAVVTPLLASSVDEITAEQSGNEISLTFGSRVWRVRGWHKNHSSEVMKINLQVRDSQSGEFFVDSLDIYHAKQRGAYLKQAAIELTVEESIIKRDMGRVLLKLEQLQDAALQAVMNPKDVEIVLNGEAESAALELLKSPDLASRIIDDLASCGVVGESSNLLVGYLAAVSRKLDRPLAVLIQSSSSAGKSSLMDAILGLMPSEERVQYSAMTGQSLYYLGETNLQHKILAIAEEEGVRQAAYALKLLQSDGELTIASTGKDESSGDLVTREYSVKGPVMLMLTTTAIDVDEELLNRCLVLSVNESREQTQAIHAAQRHKQTLEGLLAENEKEYITELHQNAQRLLRPINVVNPFAHQLTFLSDKTRTRRDHMKYLTLIQSITLLHQYQREIKQVEHRGKLVEYIEVTKDDIALANRLAHEVLGRTLDEMPPQTRKLLNLIKEMVHSLAKAQNCQASEVRFTRREIREYSHWSDSQLKNHCLRLVEMEYLLVHGGSRGHLLQYSLLWDGQGDDHSHLCGLLNVDNLPEKMAGDERKSGLNECKSASSLGQVCPKSDLENQPQSQSATGVDASKVWVEQNAVIKSNKKSPATLSPDGLTGG